MKAEVLPPARYVYRNLVVRAKKLTRPFCLSVTALYFVALLASASREGSTTNFSVLHLGDEDHHAEVVARFAARVPSSDEQHTTTRVLALDGPTFLLPQEGGGALAAGVRGGQWRK